VSKLARDGQQRGEVVMARLKTVPFEAMWRRVNGITLRLNASSD